MATILDVAKAAGVSKTTVSFILSGRKRFSKETTDRVRQAMKDLGYTVNYAARTLSTAKTDTLGIVVPQQGPRSLPQSMGAYLYDMASCAQRRGYDTLLLTGPDGVAALRHAADAHRVDGLVLMDVLNNDPRLPAAADTGIPTVVVGRPAEPLGLDCVDTDFERGAKDLVALLAKAGHREVTFVGLSQENFAAGVNYATRFLQATQRRAHDQDIVFHTEMIGTGEASDVLGNGAPAGALAGILAAHPGASALIIHNDAVTMGAAQALHDLGRIVPRDVSVVVVNPVQITAGAGIPFTAMEIDVHAVAQCTIDTLVAHIDEPGRAPVETMIRPDFVDRGTVAVIDER